MQMLDYTRYNVATSIVFGILPWNETSDKDRKEYMLVNCVCTPVTEILCKVFTGGKIHAGLTVFQPAVVEWLCVATWGYSHGV